MPFILALICTTQNHKKLFKGCAAAINENSSVDFFAGFDTYHDRQSAFEFVDWALRRRAGQYTHVGK